MKIKKTTHFRKKTGWQMIAPALFAFTTLVASGAAFEEDFESCKYGNLGGQGEWEASRDPVHYSQAQVVDGKGANRSKVVSSTVDEKAGLMTKTVSLNSKEASVFSVDFCRVGDGSGVGTWAGFWSTKTMRGYGIRVETVALKFRSGATGGTAVTFTDVSGNEIRIHNGTWYRVTYDFSPAENEIKKAVLENLTDGGSVQLYFGADQPGYKPESTSSPLGWNQAVILTGRATAGTVMFDNIKTGP